MVLVKCCITVLLISSAWAVGEKTSENEIVGEVRSGDELVSAVAQNCLTGNEPVMTCLRQKVLSYVNGLLGELNRLNRFFRSPIERVTENVFQVFEVDSPEEDCPTTKWTRS